jgi:hypothetical protein
MGKYAALCMFNATAPPEKVLLSGLYFELFTHVTRFCGKKVGISAVASCTTPLVTVDSSYNSMNWMLHLLAA